MKLKDIFMQDRQIFKDSTPQQKLQFFLDYYKWPAIAAILVLVIIGSFVHSGLTSRETVLSGISLNCYSLTSGHPYEAMIDAFLTYQGLSGDDYEVELNASLVFNPENRDTQEETYQTVQRIGAQITARQLDFMIGDLASMTSFASSGSFVDLSEILSEDQLEKLEPYILYLPRAGLDGSGAEIPDPLSPEAMEDPVPAMIDMSGCGWLNENYPYLSEPLVFCVAVNAPHRDMIRELILFLMRESI